jgi:hypothetical protein
VRYLKERESRRESGRGREREKKAESELCG